MTRKRLLAFFLTICMVFTLLPGVVLAEEADAVAAIGTSEYAALEYAFAAAQSGDTIELIGNVTITDTILINDERTLTLDLNGNTVESSLATTFRLEKGTLNVVDTAETKGGIDVIGEAFRVCGSGNASASDAILNIGEGVHVSSETDCCVFIYGKATLNTAGILTSEGVYGTIQGNGNATSAGTVVNITGGKVKQTQKIAIYVPQESTMTISGGEIEGATGIYVKSGTLYITGGSVYGVGDYADAAYNASGANVTGDAIIIDSCGYPGGAPSVIITGGKFESDNAYALRHVMTKGTTPAQLLRVTGGTFSGNMEDDESDVYADGVTGFISGGKYKADPDEDLIAEGYVFNDAINIAVPDNTAAVLFTDPLQTKFMPFSSLALALEFAPAGGTIFLLGDNSETLTVSKLIGIETKGYNLGNVTAGDGFVMEGSGDDYIGFIPASGSTAVVSETVNAAIGEGVSPEDIGELAEVINHAQASGVAAAISEQGRDSILDAAEISPEPGEQVIVEISVEVTATESDLSSGTLTFTATPVANVYVNSGIPSNSEPIPVPNSLLTGSAFTILLPLPTGFTPEEIVHQSTDGSKERFLESAAYPAAPKKFEIVTTDGRRFAKLSVTKFSSFVISAAASYVASIGSTSYYTLQEAINAAISGQTVTLLQDCDEQVSVQSKSLYIERGEFEFDSANVSPGPNCTVSESGSLVTIKYTLPEVEFFKITATATEGGTISPAGVSTLVKHAGITYTITPDEGFVIADVLVDGVSVGAVSKYTFSFVTSAHTIEARFEHDCPSKAFVDVDLSMWYHEGIDFVLGNGLFIGTSATTFEPGTEMTRAMLVTVIWRLEGNPDASADAPFTDIPAEMWYTGAVLWASENGIMEGYGDGLFGPNDPVTREHIAVILYRYADHKGYDLTASDDLSGFNDASALSPWAQTAMEWAVAEGLINGIGDATLDPVGNATRAQVATVLMRFVENVAN